MKAKVQHSGGMETTYEVERLPFVDEVFEGELVREVHQWAIPRGGYLGFVVLKARPAAT